MENTTEIEMSSSKNVKMRILLSRIILVVGIILMVFKIYTDNEPGAIPLLLMAMGAGWYFVILFQLRSQNGIE